MGSDRCLDLYSKNFNDFVRRKMGSLAGLLKSSTRGKATRFKTNCDFNLDLRESL